MVEVGHPRVVFRATHRDPEGNEATSEREVQCASNEEMLELLCQPWDALPQEPDPATSERWKATLAQLESWLSALRFELVEERLDDGSHRWVFGLRPDPVRQTVANTESEPGDRTRPAEAIHPDHGRASKSRVEVSGRVHADVGTDRSGTAVRLGGTGPGMQIVNQGLLVWSRDNIYMQVQMVANITVNAGAA